MRGTAELEECRDQVLHLIQEGLFESAEILCSFVLSTLAADHADNGNYLIFLELIADSLFAQGQFKRSLSYLQQALECRGAGRLSGRTVASKDEARLIYKSALCEMELMDTSGAMKLLESIPVSLRNVKVSVTMGKLYVDLGIKKNAINCFKHTLSLLPCSFEIIERLGTFEISSHFFTNPSNVAQCCLESNPQISLISRQSPVRNQNL